MSYKEGLLLRCLTELPSLTSQEGKENRKPQLGRKHQHFLLYQKSKLVKWKKIFLSLKFSWREYLFLNQYSLVFEKC